MRAGVFRKARRGAPAGFFAAEAAGLRWLAVDGGPRVAQVIDVGPDYLDLEEITPCRPTPEAAYAFGQALARLHRVPAPDGWGALPVEVTAGFFGPLDDPLPMIDGSFPSWPSFYAEARLRVIVEQGRKRGVFTKDDARQMEAV
ncbi:MAG: fructosamine kinase family protein, partial [Promicromonosporaceae bacterium]|nr:fructosamine kinase family protein [Promicromonosporaceae bacterium]